MTPAEFLPLVDDELRQLAAAENSPDPHQPFALCPACRFGTCVLIPDWRSRRSVHIAVFHLEADLGMVGSAMQKQKVGFLEVFKFPNR